MKLPFQDYLSEPVTVKRGLLPIEWLTVGYTAFTTILMLIFVSRMSGIPGMTALRAAALGTVVLGLLL